MHTRHPSAGPLAPSHLAAPPSLPTHCTSAGLTTLPLPPLPSLPHVLPPSEFHFRSPKNRLVRDKGQIDSQFEGIGYMPESETFLLLKEVGGWVGATGAGGLVEAANAGIATLDGKRRQKERCCGLLWPGTRSARPPSAADAEPAPPAALTRRRWRMAATRTSTPTSCTPASPRTATAGWSWSSAR